MRDLLHEIGLFVDDPRDFLRYVSIFRPTNPGDCASVSERLESEGYRGNFFPRHVAELLTMFYLEYNHGWNREG